MQQCVWVRVPSGAPRRSKLHIACSDFFQKSERTHFAAPPFQITTAALGCDLVLGVDLKACTSKVFTLSNRRRQAMPVSSSLLPVSEGTLRRADQNCAGKPERFFRTHLFPSKAVSLIVSYLIDICRSMLACSCYFESHNAALPGGAPHKRGLNGKPRPLPGPELPEGDCAGRRHVQGVHLVGHGDADDVITVGDGSGRQSVALRTQYDG